METVTDMETETETAAGGITRLTAARAVISVGAS
jgi:hypothetical protein